MKKQPSVKTGVWHLTHKPRTFSTQQHSAAEPRSNRQSETREHRDYLSRAKVVNETRGKAKDALECGGRAGEFHEPAATPLSDCPRAGGRAPLAHRPPPAPVPPKAVSALVPRSATAPKGRPRFCNVLRFSFGGVPLCPSCLENRLQES